MGTSSMKLDKSDIPDLYVQSAGQKIATVAAGVGGMSMTLADVSTLAQQIGLIVGCILVCGQAYVFFMGLVKKWKKRKYASNDK